jgi:crotonobetainyl-CoA:carnitine CoA-transferase CaiB-like acyl-CoA transferase
MNGAPAQPLAGFRVLELGDDLASAYCGRQFALWGADVIVLEREGGSPVRSMAPFARAGSGEQHSLVWEYVAAGKRAVDGAAATRGVVARLAAAADVLIVQGGAAHALPGLSIEELRQSRPDLVVVELSDFGADGPYAGYRSGELVLQALSGYLALNGEPGRPPLRAPGRLIDYVVGVNAFVGALAALFARERTGRGDLVEVAGLETLAAILPYLRPQYTGRDKLREGGTEAGVRIVRCADGWVSMLVSDPRSKPLFSEVLDIPEDAWPADLHEGTYYEVVAKCVAFLSRYAKARSADEVFLALVSRGVVCGRVNSPAELLEDGQLAERGFFIEARHPAFGELKLAGAAARLRNAAPAPFSPAPARAETVRPEDIGWEPRPPPPVRGAANALPLEGVRVLDLTQAWIGPFATLVMADLGAEVIKIESHRRPDVWRHAVNNPPALADAPGAKVNHSWFFNSVSRNKRSLCLDLASADGKALFERLALGADVVAENYTPQVMDKFGLGYDALARLRPDLVMASFSGFGKTGYLSDMKANGSSIEALAGWDFLHRYPDGPPVLMGFYQADPVCGLQMAALTLAALIRRERTGEGEAIDGAMFDASVGYLGDALLAAQLGGEPSALGNRDPDHAPSGVYPAEGDDRWIAIDIPDEAAWQALAAMVGPPLDQPGFQTLAARRAAHDAVDAALAAWTAGFDAEALMGRLQSAGVPAGVVRGLAEAIDDPQLAARGWFKTMTHADLGEHRYNGFPWRFAGRELVAATPPPRLGEHSALLLQEKLGLDAGAVEALAAKGVTGWVL